CHFFFTALAPHPVLHSFPTRRSSDLYRPGGDVFFALDVAASEFAESGGRYRLRRENLVLSSEEMIHRYEQLLDRYPIVSIEDGLDRKSTRLNSSHVSISYAVFCLKKK